MSTQAPTVFLNTWFDFGFLLFLPHAHKLPNPQFYKKNQKVQLQQSNI